MDHGGQGGPHGRGGVWGADQGWTDGVRLSSDQALK